MWEQLTGQMPTVPEWHGGVRSHNLSLPAGRPAAERPAPAKRKKAAPAWKPWDLLSDATPPASQCWPLLGSQP